MTIAVICTGCNRITPRSPCPACQRIIDQRRNARPERVWWRGKEAQRMRRHVLNRDNHTCQLRYPHLCLGHATTVDHPKGSRNPTEWSAACAPCHGRKDGQRNRRTP